MREFECIEWTDDAHIYVTKFRLLNTENPDQPPEIVDLIDPLAVSEVEKLVAAINNA